MKRIMIFLTLFAIMSWQGGQAQTSPVKLLDLSLFPLIETGLPDAYPTKYRISFKISDISLAQTVHFMLGTAQNQSDILSAEATVVNNNGVYYLSHNSAEFPMLGKEARFELIITQAQWEAFSVATLFVTDTAGQNTNSLYFNK
ncbi:MAG: hypothetical protein HY738_03355 [Bacteroidia bacterium]|nr:hypothetical protein [Bacteroidia bacterium]